MQLNIPRTTFWKPLRTLGTLQICFHYKGKVKSFIPPNVLLVCTKRVHRCCRSTVQNFNSVPRFQTISLPPQTLNMYPSSVAPLLQMNKIYNLSPLQFTLHCQISTILSLLFSWKLLFILLLLLHIFRSVSKYFYIRCLLALRFHPPCHWPQSHFASIYSSSDGYVHSSDHYNCAFEPIFSLVFSLSIWHWNRHIAKKWPIHSDQFKMFFLYVSRWIVDDCLYLS